MGEQLESTMSTSKQDSALVSTGIAVVWIVAGFTWVYFFGVPPAMEVVIFLLILIAVALFKIARNTHPKASPPQAPVSPVKAQGRAVFITDEMMSGQGGILGALQSATAQLAVFQNPTEESIRKVMADDWNDADLLEEIVVFAPASVAPIVRKRIAQLRS